MKKLSQVKEVLMVVDVINGFINVGNMKDEYIKHIVPGIEKLVKEYVKDIDKEVFYIRDSHKSDSIEFEKYPVHCLENTIESEMIDELKEYENNVRTYLKNSTSAIFAKGLLEDLKKIKGLKKVVVVGCCSDICVLNLVLPLVNYFDENDLRVEVEVKEDLIETYDSPIHNRDEYNEMAKVLIKQVGAKLTRNEVKKNAR